MGKHDRSPAAYRAQMERKRRANLADEQTQLVIDRMRAVLRLGPLYGVEKVDERARFLVPESAWIGESSDGRTPRRKSM